MNNCKHCGAPTKTTFCSRSCAAKTNNLARTSESRAKQRQTVLSYYGKDPATPKKARKPNPLVSATKLGIPYTPVRSCTACGKWFNIKLRPSTTCSDTCFMYVKSVLNRRGKKHTHETGIVLDSTWELEIAKYLDSIQVEWERPSTSLLWVDSTGKQRKYFADFFLPKYNVYLDPKSEYVQHNQSEKLQYLKANYSNVVWGSVNELKTHITNLVSRERLELPLQPSQSCSLSG